MAKIDLKPVLARILQNGGELRVKNHFDKSTLVIDRKTLEEFDEIAFDPNPNEGKAVNRCIHRNDPANCPACESVREDIRSGNVNEEG